MKSLNNKLLAKKFVGFLLRMVLIYGLFVVLWFNWGEFYGEIFRAGSNILFGSYGNQTIIHFQSYQPKDKKSILDTQVTITQEKSLLKGNRLTKSIKISSKHFGYTSTILVISLILATPMMWKRQLWTLLWGIILVHIFIVFRMTIGLLAFFSHNEAFGIITFNPFWQKILNFISTIFVVHIGISYIVPVIIWVLVTFRRSSTDFIGGIRINKIYPISKRRVHKR